MTSVYDFHINGADHRPYDLSQHRGKPLLLINLPLSSKQSSLSPSFEAARSVYLKYRHKIQVLGIPILTSSSGREERSIFAEYPVMEAIEVKNSFGGTINPPLYHFLNSSMTALQAAGDGSAGGGIRSGQVDKILLCFLMDGNGRLVKVLPPETTESKMDDEISALVNPSAGGGIGGAVDGELASEELLRFIVDKVNELFTLNYSLFAFDELKGRKLLQLVNDVFARLQPQLATDMNSANLDEVIPRMIEFLTKTLGYKIPPLFQQTFPDSFAKAETTVIYPVLYWTLSRMEQNEKRVYLARFLQPLDVPEAILGQDEDVRFLFTQYQTLRAKFIPAHRRVEELRKSFADPQQIRRQVANLEGERDHLIQYIKTAQSKIENLPEKDALLAACRSLRLAQVEENKLAEKKVELQQRKISADFHRAEMSNRLQNLRRDAADGRGDVIIRRLKDEIQTNRIKLEEQLPVEVEHKSQETTELRRLLTEPLDIAQLQSENQLLDKDLQRLHAKVQERQKPGEDGTSISTIHQQMQRVQTRKSDLMKELNTLQGDYNHIVSEIMSTEGKIAQLRAATQMPNGEEFKELSQQVRAKRAATDSMRTRLEETHAEWGTLVFTENILKEQFQQLDREIGDLESKLGMQGYSQTLETLHRLTHEKDALEELKGRTLEELSKVSQDMVMIIRDRRTKMAPLINELRSVRESSSELQREWEEKKNQYEHQESLLAEDIRKLTNTVMTLKSEVGSNETLYHRLHTQGTLQQANEKRIADEKRFNTEPGAALNPQYKTHLEQFHDCIRDLEVRSKEWQVRRRAIEENHEHNVHQVDYFRHLKKILEAKVKSLKAQQGHEVKDEMTLDEAIDHTMGKGVDMLVLNTG